MTGTKKACLPHASLCAIYFALLAIASVAPVLASTVTVVTSFPADVGPGRKDHPDEAGAVGIHHIVDFDDRNFVVHDKSTGRVVLTQAQQQFWSAAQPANTLRVTANDPRILYDPLCARWFATAADVPGGNGYLAVSTSSDPTKPWNGVQLPMAPRNLGMKIGVDKNGFYITYLNLNNDVHTMHDCIAIPIADAIAPGGPVLSHVATFHNLEIESFPATDLNPNKDAAAPEVLLNKEFGNDCGKLFMYKITWAGATASISPLQTIPLSRVYVTPNGGSRKNLALQPPPGASLRADEGRRTICVYAQGGSVYCCNGAKLSLESRPGILWCEVRVSDGALLQEGFVDDASCDYLFPSLAVDRDGNIGLGCTRTSATEFPSTYVMMHASSDPAGTMRKPVLAMPGTDYYRDSKASSVGPSWGCYSSTCLDPVDPQLFWTCQQYGGSATDLVWTTAWTSFRLK